MTNSADLETLLASALGRPMTARQAARLDASRAARLAARRRPARLRPAVLLVAAMLLAASTLVAVSAAMRTTESPKGMESASAYQAEIDAAKAQVPVPSGYAWPASLRAADPDGSYATGGGRSQVEFAAVCAWTTSWLDAGASGSASAERKAAGVLAGVRGWDLYRGAFSSDSLRAVLDGIIAATAAGDRGAVASFAHANCGR